MQGKNGNPLLRPWSTITFNSDNTGHLRICFCICNKFYIIELSRITLVTGPTMGHKWNANNTIISKILIWYNINAKKELWPIVNLFGASLPV